MWVTLPWIHPVRSAILPAVPGAPCRCAPRPRPRRPPARPRCLRPGCRGALVEPLNWVPIRVSHSNISVNLSPLTSAWPLKASPIDHPRDRTAAHGVGGASRTAGGRSGVRHAARAAPCPAAARGPPGVCIRACIRARHRRGGAPQAAAMGRSASAAPAARRQPVRPPLAHPPGIWRRALAAGERLARRGLERTTGR
jgi:hypothetical protein